MSSNPLGLDQPFLDTSWAHSPDGTDAAPTTNVFKWGNVTSTDPLRIRLDGETAELPITPDTLVDPLSLATNDRVWTQQWGSRIVVLGRGGGNNWRDVGTAVRTTSLSYSASDQNVATLTLPQSLTRVGRQFRIEAFANVANDTAGNYTDLQVKIGQSASVGGTQIGASYADHRLGGRIVGAYVKFDYTYAEVEDVADMNIVLVIHPSANQSLVNASAARPTTLFVATKPV